MYSIMLQDKKEGKLVKLMYHNNYKSRALKSLNKCVEAEKQGKTKILWTDGFN